MRFCFLSMQAVAVVVAELSTADGMFTNRQTFSYMQMFARSCDAQKRVLASIFSVNCPLLHIFFATGVHNFDEFFHLISKNDLNLFLAPKFPKHRRVSTLAWKITRFWVAQWQCTLYNFLVTPMYKKKMMETYWSRGSNVYLIKLTPNSSKLRKRPTCLTKFYYLINNTWPSFISSANQQKYAGIWPFCNDHEMKVRPIWYCSLRLHLHALGWARRLSPFAWLSKQLSQLSRLHLDYSLEHRQRCAEYNAVCYRESLRLADGRCVKVGGRYA